MGEKMAEIDREMTNLEWTTAIDTRRHAGGDGVRGHKETGATRWFDVDLVTDLLSWLASNYHLHPVLVFHILSVYPTTLVPWSRPLSAT